MKNNKILMLINQPFPYKTGGTEVKLSNQLKYLDKNHVSVTLLATNSAKRTSFFPGINKIVKIKNIGFAYRTFENNIVMKSLYWALLHFYFIFASIIISLREKFDLIEIKDPYSGIAGVIIKKISKKPLVLETAGAFGSKQARLYNIKFGSRTSKVLFFIINSIEKFVYRNCDAIITEDDITDYLKKIGFKGYYKRIPNGVDNELFKSERKEALKGRLNLKNKRIILYLGRLDPEKNVLYIIENFGLIKKQLKNSSLVIVGTGIEEKKLKSLASKSPYKKDILFEGFRMNTKDYYNIADVLVISSHYESLPGVLLESMACRVPVVSTKVGMIPEVITEGKNGFLFGLTDKKGFVSKVIKAVKNKDYLGNNALKNIREKYAWNKLIANYLGVYKKLI